MLIPIDVKLCECGCGKSVNFNKRFIQGHNCKKSKFWENKKEAWNKGLTKETDERVKKYSEKQMGRHHTEETKQKISLVQKRQDIKEAKSKIHKGKKLSDKTKELIREKSSKISLEKWQNETYRENHLNAFRSKETKEKMSKASIQRWANKEYRIKQSQSLINFYNNLTYEQREELGKHSSFYIDGRHKNNKKYHHNWINIRRNILKRDNFSCQCCGIREDSCKRKLSVHHIDYNINNNDINNLISLCSSCHARSNVNREQEYNMYSHIVKYHCNPNIDDERSNSVINEIINKREKIEELFKFNKERKRKR